MITTAGRSLLADRATQSAQAVVGWMAIGSGSTPASLSDTTLGSEITRAALTSATSSANVMTYTASFSVGSGTGSFSEIGLFNASSGGTMLSRMVIPTASFLSTDSMTLSVVLIQV